MYPFFDWVTDRAIHDLEQRGDTCYIVGDFESISKRTGAGVLLDPKTLEIVADFPEVNGAIYCATPDGEGGVFIGGSFTMVGGKYRQNFAHIDNGLQVTDFQVSTAPLGNRWYGSLLAIALYQDKIYLGGRFTTVNGIKRNLIAELDRRTGELTNFDFDIPDKPPHTVANTYVSELVVHNNLLFFGGEFNEVMGSRRAEVACLNLDTHELTPWDPQLTESTNTKRVSTIITNDSSVFLSGHFYQVHGQARNNITQVDIQTGQPLPLSYGKSWHWGDDMIAVHGAHLFVGKTIVDIPSSLPKDTLRISHSYYLNDENQTVVIGDTMYMSIIGSLLAIDLNSFQPFSEAKFSGDVTTICRFGQYLLVGGQFSGGETKPLNSIGAIVHSENRFLPLPYILSDGSVFDKTKIHEIVLEGSNAYIAGRFDYIKDTITDADRLIWQKDIAKINLNTGQRADWHAKIGEGRFGEGHGRYPPKIRHLRLLEGQLLTVGNYTSILEEASRKHPYRNTSGVNLFDTETGNALYDPLLSKASGHMMSDVALSGDTAIFSSRVFRQSAGHHNPKGFYFVDTKSRSLLNVDIPLSKKITSITSLLPLNENLYFPAGSYYWKSSFQLHKLNLHTLELEKLPITFDGPVNEMVYMGNHTVYVAGNFNNVNGFPRKQLAAIDLRTYEVKPWNPNIPPQPLDIQRMKAWEDQLAIMGSFEYLGSTYAPNLALLDTAAGTYAQLSGRAYWDLNQNHQFDGDDQPMAGYAVDVQPGNYYATTDSLGFYRLAVDSGVYTLNLIVPEKRGFAVQRQHPPAEVGYTFSTDTLTEPSNQLDFAYFGEPRPHLSVDLDAGRRRRCFTGVTTVSYRNEGLLSAPSARVQIQYPEHVVAFSSTPAWDERDGNVLTYYVGDLSPDQSGRIVIRDSVVCGDESIRGLTQCTEARIFPTNNRPLDPRWDQSETTVDAYCQDNGFVRIRLKNTGPEAMADSAAFRIYLDGELAYHSNYQLSAGDSLILSVPSLGKTLRTEADLTAFHPDKTMNTVTVEGCGGSETTTISTGLVNSYSQNDEEDAFELSCSPIVDSYDPNDKQVVPTGIREEHFTQEESELEYTIRFQNTGTDTAYTVVIVDTLSEHLDLSTLRLGVASHPVEWTLSGRGVPVLTWRFNQIDLPDSNRNEPASHGFVKFKIAMKKELPRGTMVANQAGIYFDYNSPIITNATFNTVGLPEDTIVRTEVQDCSQRPLRTGHRIDTVYLCGEHQLLLDAEDFGGGFGQWRLLEGQGSFEDPFAAQTSLNNIALGVNRVIWQVVYCDQSASHELIITRSEGRLDPPEVASNVYSYCAGEVTDTLFAHGRSVRWYDDRTLTHLLSSGNSFRPEPSGLDTLYVTQTDGHCQSAAQKILVVAMPPPPPPVVIAYEHCDNIATTEFSAEGQNLVWYTDSLGSQVVGTGNTLVLPSEEILTTFYVSQTVNDCESGLSTLPIEIINFSTHDVFIPNVITPNSDQKNDYFFVPSSPLRHCLGDFQEVRIQNRWGKTIYHNRDEHFQWHPSRKVSAGVYFYSIRFSNVKLNGSISILR